GSASAPSDSPPSDSHGQPLDSAGRALQASGPQSQAGQVVADVTTTESTSSLASTGAPVTEMIGWSVGSLLIGVGRAVVGRSRRRRPVPAVPVPASPASP